ncbi:MAG: vitamin B12-dependent ribonucleotide reductase [Thermoplasmata archaeon]|nr:vitamin B12-dependent ribonucleotide reductase [Thermoplasmata archaeon]
MKLTSTAISVLEKRYLAKDENGKITETPDQMFRRVARAIAGAELNYGTPGERIKNLEEEFYRMMSELEFLPNSPTLMNAGRELGQLAACFVLPVEDSISSIFETLKHAALIHKSGGGTGFSFSRLRPSQDVVKTTSGISSGPVSFMEVYNAATEAIKQGGTRRGANMGVLHVSHPDITHFIDAKLQEGKLSNFNISVAVTDEFMEAVKKDGEYALINPRNGAITSKVKAREIFRKIAENAWKSGEPGIIFIDEINRHNPTPEIGKIEATNPCGEQPLLPYESCNLGSINLAKMLKKTTKGWEIDWEKLRICVINAVRFLDDVIDANRYPLPEIERITKANRKIGLGVMGFADLLIYLKIPYDSEEALKTGSQIMNFITETARRASEELGRERGNFPNFEKSIWAGKTRFMRNAAVTTIAPTGTLSMIAGCSSGIEPIFALAYTKTVLEGTEFHEVSKAFEDVMREEGYWSEDCLRHVSADGTARKLNIPDNLKRIFVTALEIAPEWHVRMQAEFQKFVDNAVSKTINLPENASVEDVEKAFMLAYDLKCKGITVYRNRSREVQVLSVRKERKIVPRPRPVATTGKTIRVETGCGYLYVTINEDEQGLCEVFATMGKSGGCAMSQIEGISRLISIGLRAGLEIDSIIKQLKGIRCPSPRIGKDGAVVLSCADGIAHALEEYIKHGKEPKKLEFTLAKIAPRLDDYSESGNVVGICPDCGNSLIYAEGCVQCKNCGYSKCQ